MTSSSCFLPVAQATEITWTPANDGEDGGPLPASQNQRQQLYQLEQAIVQSPDPQGTLNQVAQANGMHPNELLDLLQKNHQAMVDAGDIPASGRGGASRNVWKAMSSAGIVISHVAKSNPKVFSMIVTTVLLLLYMSIMAPRTGVVLSSNRGTFLLSKGPTTLFAPPTPYLQQVITSSKICQKDPTFAQPFPIESLLQDEKTQNNNKNNDVDVPVVWHKLKSKRAKKVLKQVASATVTLNVVDDNHLDVESIEEEDLEHILDTYYRQAVRVLEEGHYTEWASSASDDDDDDSKATTKKKKNAMKMVMSDEEEEEEDQRNAVLVVKGMGDYRRYGLIFLRPLDAHTIQKKNQYQIVYSTLRGSSFDGQIQVQVTRNKKQSPNTITLQFYLVIPKSGKAIAKSRAMQIVETLTSSIRQSIRMNSKQALARKLQSARFQGSAKARATERRQTRHRLEQEIEEMASERRRRWQRQNPNAGSYRPSNIRQQSPNNC